MDGWLTTVFMVLAYPCEGRARVRSPDGEFRELQGVRQAPRWWTDKGILLPSGEVTGDVMYRTSIGLGVIRQAFRSSPH